MSKLFPRILAVGLAIGLFQTDVSSSSFIVRQDTKIDLFLVNCLSLDAIGSQVQPLLKYKKTKASGLRALAKGPAPDAASEIRQILEDIVLSTHLQRTSDDARYYLRQRQTKPEGAKQTLEIARSMIEKPDSLLPVHISRKWPGLKPLLTDSIALQAHGLLAIGVLSTVGGIDLSKQCRAFMEPYFPELVNLAIARVREGELQIHNAAILALEEVSKSPWISQDWLLAEQRTKIVDVFLEVVRQPLEGKYDRSRAITALSLIAAKADLVELFRNPFLHEPAELRMAREKALRKLTGSTVHISQTQKADPHVMSAAEKKKFEEALRRVTDTFGANMPSYNTESFRKDPLKFVRERYERTHRSGQRKKKAGTVRAEEGSA